ncbi:translocation/assembly module TamB domain-containing protein [Bartonella sp. DGB1]|uniref:translocation/assembly module TamB domain-containing protein n=1 Tax=Bartonella sp. DGB1 TaxID=3239807 RepID=UPI00352451CC
MKLIKEISWWIIICFSLLFITFTYNFFQKKPINQHLGDFVSYLASSKEQRIEIPEINNIFSKETNIPEIRIKDKRGTWLELNDVTIDYNFLPLFISKLDINNLNIGHAKFIRTPQATSQKSNNDQIKLPLNINFKNIDIEELTICKEILTKEANLQINSSMKLDKKNYLLKLKGHNLKNKKEKINLSLNYDLLQQTVELNTKLNSPSTGIFAHWLNPSSPQEFNLNINGKGYLNNLILNVNGTSKHKKILDANLTANLLNKDYLINFTVNNYDPLFLPTNYKNIISSPSHIKGQVIYDKKKNIHLNNFSLKSNNADIEASALLLADGFLRNLKLNLLIEANNSSIILPLIKETFTAKKIKMLIDYGNNTNWKANLDIEDLDNKLNQKVNLNAKLWGESHNLDDNEHREITLQGNVDANLNKDNKLLPLHANFQGKISPQYGYNINNLTINSVNNKIITKIALNKDNLIKAETKIKADDLNWLSFFTKKHITGNLQLYGNLTGKLYDNFDIIIQGKLNDLNTPYTIINELLANQVTLDTNISYKDNLLKINNFAFNNKKNSLNISGTYSPNNVNLNYYGNFNNIKLFLPHISAPINFAGKATGNPKTININTNLNTKEGTISDRALAETQIKLSHEIDREKSTLFTPYIQNKINLNSKLGNDELKLNATVNLLGDWRPQEIHDLDFKLGASIISANIDTDYKKSTIGRIHINSPDIKEIGKLFNISASGKLQADVLFSKDRSQQNVKIKSKIDNLVWNKNKIEHADTNAIINNIFNFPTIEGYAKLTNLTYNNFNLDNANLTATTKNKLTNFQLTASLNKAENLIATGSFKHINNNDWSLDLSKLYSSLNILPLNLRQETKITFSNNEVTINNLLLDIMNGSIKANGSLGKQLNLAVNINKFNISIINYLDSYINHPWLHNLQLEGLLSGQLLLSGSPKAPVITLNSDIKNFTNRILKKAKIMPIDIYVESKNNDDNIDVNAKIKNKNLLLTVNGSVDSNYQNLSLKVTSKNIPIDIINQFTTQNIPPVRGLLTGDAIVTGKLTNPKVDFKIQSNNLEVKLTDNLSINSTQLTSIGKYFDNSLILHELKVKNQQGVDFTTNGEIDIHNLNLNLNTKGSLPLNLLHLLLSTESQVTGLAIVDSKIQGNLLDPNMTGVFTIDNGTIFIPEISLSLKNINGFGKLDKNKIIFEQLIGTPPQQKGTVKGKGEIILDFANNIPLDVLFHFDDAYYHYSDNFQTNITGILQIQGNLECEPFFSGEIILNKAVITLPDTFDTAPFLDVEHIKAPYYVIKTLKRAGVLKDDTQISNDYNMKFDLLIKSPTKILVKGQNLTVELNGQIHLLTDATVGNFKMIQGRYELLGKSIIFTEGKIFLLGDLTPQLYFVSQTPKEDYLLTLTVSGTPSNISIIFSSSPELPQEEIIARLVFNKSINELNIFQIGLIMLQISKNQNNMFLAIETLRNFLKLDRLDIITNEKDYPGISLGRSIRENIYLEVETSAEGYAKGALSIDLNNDIKTKAILGTNGKSSLGIFYNTDF